MTDMEKDAQREKKTRERMSMFVRSRILTLELGVKIIAMNFVTGEAILHFTQDDAPIIAAMAGGGTS